MKISHDELLRIIRYDPNTGLLRWRERLSNNTHVGDIVGNIDTPTGYRHTLIHKKRYGCHRLAWFYVHAVWPETIDHINGVRDDNRLCNLREATIGENTQNRRVAKRGSKSGLLGVTQRPKGFETSIILNGKYQYLGLFATAEEAHAVYVTAKRQLHPMCTI